MYARNLGSYRKQPSVKACSVQGTLLSGSVFGCSNCRSLPEGVPNGGRAVIASYLFISHHTTM